MATNDSGTVASDAVLTVLGKPAFITELKDQYVIEGQPAQFEVKIAGYPEPEIKWLCNEQELSPNDLNVRQSKRPDGIVRLLIEETTQENAGNYRVIAVNRLGKVESHAVLSVSPKLEDRAKKGEKPAFVQGLEDTSVDEGFPIKLLVRVTGIPAPKLIWFQNGKEIVSKPGYIRITENPDNTASLAIHEAAVSDSGVYKVVATNDNGTAETEGELKVLSKTGKDDADEIKKKIAERSGKDDEPGTISLCLEAHFNHNFVKIMQV